MNVFDFDNTIYDGESGIDLFFHYVKQMPELIKYLPKVISAFSSYEKGEVTLDRMLYDYAPIIELNLKNIGDVEEDIKAFWDNNMDKIKPFYYQIHKDDDMIISASPDYSIKEISSRLGIKKYIASEVDLKECKILSICMKDNKVKAFLKQYPNEKIENFYTDSPENDQPLIDFSEHAYVVKGNTIRQVK